jgi:hypothetical protein
MSCRRLSEPSVLPHAASGYSIDRIFAVYSLSSLSIHCLFTVYSLSIQSFFYLLTAYSLPTRCLLYVHSMHVLRIHCLCSLTDTLTPPQVCCYGPGKLAVHTFLACSLYCALYSHNFL